MKYFLLLLILICFNNNLLSQTFDIYKGDTINVVDKNNTKQGLWIYFNDNYKNRISQWGKYRDGAKDGAWETFYSNGNLKSKIEYQKNRQNGLVNIYYENGTIQEEGFWRQNRWIGEYKFYYPTGKIKYHWYYNDNGKRTGTQAYFYENGQKQIEGQWAEGKENGKITEYYSNGKVEKVSNFQNGDLNGSVVEYYSDGQVKSRSVFVNGQVDINQNYAYGNKNNPDNNVADNNQNNQDDPEYKRFNGNGYYKFVNENGQIDREGTFENGILVDGKKYIYDDKGKKIKTAIIINGRIIRYIIEETE